jgi:hypothetical protein
LILRFDELDCPRDDCRFTPGVMSVTCVYFPPSYDKNGNNLNSDGNVTSGKVACTKCGREWDYREQYGKATYTEIK